LSGSVYHPECGSFPNNPRKTRAAAPSQSPIVMGIATGVVSNETPTAITPTATATIVERATTVSNLIRVAVLMICSSILVGCVVLPMRARVALGVADGASLRGAHTHPESLRLPLLLDT
jgi:hypothetical protein